MGIHRVADLLAELVGVENTKIPSLARTSLRCLVAQIEAMQTQIDKLEALILEWNKGNETSRRLAKVAGVGPITASAVVATIGDASNFTSGRHLSAALGLTPRQNSSGGKVWPVMAGATRLDADQHLGLRLEEAEHVAAAELAAEHDLAGTIDPMHLEEVLGDVEADGDRDGLCATIHCGRHLSLDSFSSSELGVRCLSGPSTASPVWRHPALAGHGVRGVLELSCCGFGARGLLRCIAEALAQFDGTLTEAGNGPAQRRQLGAEGGDGLPLLGQGLVQLA